MTTRSRLQPWRLLPIYVLTSVLVSVLFSLAGVDPFGSVWVGLIWFCCWMGLASILKGMLWFALLLIKPEWSDVLRN